MNLPNKLTVARIFLVPVFLVFLYGGSLLVGKEAHLADGIFRTGALLVVIIVTITDWLDGKLARQMGLASNFGRLLDPLADKIFVTAALVAMVEIRLIPAWAVIIIVSREFLITGLRSLAQESGRVISADRIGKHKTGWQLALIIAAIAAMAGRDFCLAGEVWASPLVANYSADLIFELMIWIPLGVTLLLTVWSAWNYAVLNKDLFRGHL